MSDIAEFAGRLHKNESKIYSRAFNPVQFESLSEKIHDVRAVICDVYGTLINYWKPGFEDKTMRENLLLSAFRQLIEKFKIELYLLKMNPDAAPEKTLSDLYNGLISLSHQNATKNGVKYPEVKIEKVWELILMMLKRHGYQPVATVQAEEKDIPRCFAYTYNFLSLGRQLYPGVVDALQKLRARNIVVGILSNAQFYTPIDLTLMIRDQSNEKIEDYLELFDIDLTFYSYEYGFSKPNQLLFRRLFDALYEYNILPEQTVMLGNDLLIDIAPAKAAGMKTALFTGDAFSFFAHEEKEIVPDIVFDQWTEIPEKISFYAEGRSQCD
ncbi:MAG TPA: HAD family hydrolase [Chitinispirillaceae bacterium]|nr:HAD family hydrolase [Chitinispirillaceae bacterium]